MIRTFLTTFWLITGLSLGIVSLKAETQVDITGQLGQPLFGRILVDLSEFDANPQIAIADSKEYQTQNLTKPDFLSGALLSRAQDSPYMYYIDSDQALDSSRFDLLLKAQTARQQHWIHYAVQLEGGLTSIKLINRTIKNFKVEPVDTALNTDPTAKNNTETKELERTAEKTARSIPPRAEKSTEIEKTLEDLSRKLNRIKFAQGDNSSDLIYEDESRDSKSQPNETKVVQKNVQSSKTVAKKTQTPSVESDLSAVGEDVISTDSGAGELLYNARDRNSREQIVSEINQNTDVNFLKFFIYIAGSLVLGLTFILLYVALSRKFDTTNHKIESTSHGSNRAPSLYPPMNQAPMASYQDAQTSQILQSIDRNIAQLGNKLSNPDRAAETSLQSASRGTPPNRQFPRETRQAERQVAPPIDNRGSKSTPNRVLMEQRAPLTPESKQPTTTQSQLDRSTQPTQKITSNPNTPAVSGRPNERDSKQTTESFGIGGGTKKPTTQTNSRSLSKQFQLASVYQNMGDLGMAKTLYEEICKTGSDEEKLLAKQELINLGI